MRRNRLRWMLPLMGGVAPSQVVLTCTTTGAATLTLNRLGAVTGKTIHVDWGDGTSNDYSDNPSSTRTHAYAGAGTWKVTISPPEAVVNLDLRDTKLSCAAGQIGKMTALTSLNLSNLANATIGAGEIGGLTSLTDLTMAYIPNATIGAGEIGGLIGLTILHLDNIPNATIGAGEIGGLTDLTTVYLSNLANVTVGAGEIGGLTDLTYLNLSNLANVTVGAGEIGGLTDLTYLNLSNLANVTVGAGEIGGLTDLTYLYLINSNNIAAQTGLSNLLKLTWLQYENGLSQAQVDSVLTQLYSAFPTRTGINGTIDLLGDSNAAPSGTAPGSAECPPTTGWNKAYELVNDSCNVSANHWASVTCQT